MTPVLKNVICIRNLQTVTAFSQTSIRIYSHRDKSKFLSWLGIFHNDNECPPQVALLIPKPVWIYVWSCHVGAPNCVIVSAYLAVELRRSYIMCIYCSSFNISSSFIKCTSGSGSKMTPQHDDTATMLDVISLDLTPT